MAEPFAAAPPPTLPQAPGTPPPQAPPTVTQPSGPTGPAEVSLSLKNPGPPAQTPPTGQARPLGADEIAAIRDPASRASTGAPPPNTRKLSPEEIQQINPADAAVKGLADRLMTAASDKEKDWLGMAINGAAMVAGGEFLPAKLGITAAATELAPWLRAPLQQMVRMGTHAMATGVGAATAGAASQAAQHATIGGENPTPASMASDFGQFAAGDALGIPLTGMMRGGLNFLAKRGLVPPSWAAPFASRVSEHVQNTYGGPPLPGVKPTPAQLNPNRAVQFAEAYGRAGLGSTFEAEDAANTRVIEQYANDLVDQFGPKASNEEAGQAIKDATGRAMTPPTVSPAQAGAPPELQGAQAGATRAGLSARDAGTAAQSAASTAEGQRAALAARAGPAGGRERTGQLLTASANAGEKAARQVGNQLFGTVDQLAGDTKVPLGPTMDVARGLLGEYDPITQTLTRGQGAGATKVIARAGEAADEAASAAETAGAGGHGGPLTNPAGTMAHPALLNDPKYQAAAMAIHDAGISAADMASGDITFSQAHQLRSTLGQMIYEAKNSAAANADVNVRFLTMLRNSIDASMTEAAGGPESALRQAYDAATSHWRDQVGAYSRGILSKAIETGKVDPRRVVAMIVQPGRAAETQQLWKFVSPAAKQAVQAQVLRDALFVDGGTVPKTPKAIMAWVNKMGTETLSAIFDRATTQQLTDLAPAFAESGAKAEAADAAAAGHTAAQQTLAKATAAADKATAAAEAEHAGFAADLLRHQEKTPITFFANALKEGDTVGVRKLRTLVGASDWQQVQSAHLQDLLFSDGGTLRTAEQLKNELGKYTDTTLGAIYDPATVEQLKSIQRSLAIISPKSATKFNVALRYGQGAALLDLISMPVRMATGHAAGASEMIGIGTALLSPPMVTKIMMNPAARAWLTTGLAAKAAGDTGLAGRMAGQLTAWLLRENLLTAPGTAPPQVAGPGANQPGPGGRAGGPPPLPAGLSTGGRGGG
jgi:hypothetical protein